jgi:predicted Zn-dependent protease
MKIARHRKVSLAAVLAAVSCAACATNPVTGNREFSLMSEAQEVEIGQQLDPEVRNEMGVYGDQALQEYVEEIGMRLARQSHRPNLPWHFTVVDVPAINAFALPGGYIYVTRGLLAYLNDEAQLAGVLGHEIGHVTARHAAQAYTKATTGGLGLTVLGIFVPASRPFGGLAESALGVLFLKYGRDDELQSDRLGAEYAVKNGWDPGGVAGMLTTLARIEETGDRRGVPNWLSTHPQAADRVDRLRATVAELSQGTPESLAANRDEYVRRIDGIVFGDNPEEGVVRGSSFVHPDLRFSVEMPEGWEINNGKTQVVAKSPGEEQYVILQLVENPRGGSIEEVAERGMSSAGFRPVQGTDAQINGLTAHVGTYQGSVQGMGRVLTRAAHIQLERRVYRLAGIASPDDYPRVERWFDETIQSFRALNRTEAADVRPNHVDLYTVRAGDTWQSIAQRAGEGNVKATTLAIMNSYPVNEQPRPGDRIKIIVAG